MPRPWPARLRAYKDTCQEPSPENSPLLGTALRTWKSTYVPCIPPAWTEQRAHLPDQCHWDSCWQPVPQRDTCQVEHRPAGPEEKEWTLLEQESSELRSLAVASPEDHAQALLTPGHQVKPAQLALTSHLYRLRAGHPTEGRVLSAKEQALWGEPAWGGQPAVPQTLLRPPPGLQPVPSPRLGDISARMPGALVTSQGCLHDSWQSQS